MSAPQVLQNAATANGNGLTFEASPGLGKLLMEIRETAGGTCTCTFEGSFDGTNWYAAIYQPIVTATLTPSITGVSVTANLASVYEILKEYPQIRARISAIAGGGTVTVKAYGSAT